MGCAVIEHFQEIEFNDADFGKNLDARVDAQRTSRKDFSSLKFCSSI